jgi:hypothetical protein
MKKLTPGAAQYLWLGLAVGTGQVLAHADLGRTPNAGKPATGDNLAGAPLAQTVPEVTVQPFRDGGGLVQEPDTEPLPVRLAVSLEKYLREEAGERYTVRESDTTGSAQPGAAPALPTRFSIEGELSHVPKNTVDGGPYLCTVRLFRQTAGQNDRRLVGQWAGWAETLRYLTANLRHDPRVNKQGLIGELGKRLKPFLVPYDAISAQTILTPWLASIERNGKLPLEAAAVPIRVAEVTGSSGPAAGSPVANETPNAGAIVASQGWQLRVVAPHAGEVRVLENHAGNWRLLELNDKASSQTAAGSQPLLLPTRPLQGAVGTVPQQRKLVVLWHRSAQADPLGWSPLQVGGKAQDPAPVQVVGETASEGDEALGQLALLASSEPAENWAARTVEVRLLPAREAP